MTIDDRLDRLTERHEALTQSVELLLQETREMRVVQEKDSENIRALRAVVDKDSENIRALYVAVDKDAENIRALARIAEIHEHRITDIEGGERKQ